jgi:large repetitive protein
MYRTLPHPLLHLLLLLAAAGCATTAALPPLAVEAPADIAQRGIVHRAEHRAAGPWSIHVVEVDPRVCGVSIGTVKGGDRLDGVETTSTLTRRAGARVGINADFFRAQPFGVVEGPQVAGGEVVATAGNHGPSVSTRFAAAQGVFGVTADGIPFVGEGRIEGSVRVRRGTAPLARVNAPPGPDSLALYGRFAGDSTPGDDGVIEVVLHPFHPTTTAGDMVGGVVVAVDTLPSGVPIPRGGAVLAARGTARTTLRELAPGDTVWWTLPVRGAPGRVAELVGGFPLLLLDGRRVLERVPTIRPAFALEGHPRSAVAVRADGTVLIVAVDGRQPDFSVGMTLPELTDLLLELGAVDALNLDGGGSTTLVVDGRIVNRPSDPVERAVTNALVVREVPGACAAGDRSPPG